jgi:hypothetical protein
MIWQQLRLAVLTGAFTVAAAVAARAEEAAPSASAPQTCTVMVREWVPEQYECTRTVYKTETRHEKYTAYKTECVPEERTRTVNVVKMVPVKKTITRDVCVTVPVQEERTVMQTHVTCKPVTKMVRKCVDKGHYECRQVPCDDGGGRRRLFGRLLGRKKKDCNDCCDPCADACCVPMKTVRVWVPCPTWEEHAVTVMERVCETKAVKCMVTVCKREIRKETCEVTVCERVCEQKVEKCIVNVAKCVPYEAVRNVCVCVPTTEKYMATRMVCREVAKQVPVTPCATSCCETTCCKTDCCESRVRKCRRAGLGLRGCGSSCGGCCN